MRLDHLLSRETLVQEKPPTTPVRRRGWLFPRSQHPASRAPLGHLDSRIAFERDESLIAQPRIRNVKLYAKTIFRMRVFAGFSRRGGRIEIANRLDNGIYPDSSDAPRGADRATHIFS